MAGHQRMLNAPFSVSDWWSETLSERAIGASAGAILSLVYLLPMRWQEAAARFATGIICGLVFGSSVASFIATRFKIDVPPQELQLAGACAASFCSWWVLGLLTRHLKRSEKTKSDHKDAR